MSLNRASDGTQLLLHRTDCSLGRLWPSSGSMPVAASRQSWLPWPAQSHRPCVMHEGDRISHRESHVQWMPGVALVGHRPSCGTFREGYRLKGQVLGYIHDGHDIGSESHGEQSP